MKILLVAAGGALGSVLRYLVGGLMHDVLHADTFPIGTFTVNVVGCLCIGLLSYLIEDRSVLTQSHRLFLVVGVLGGFTTFSSFGNETVALLRDGESFYALLNIAGNVLIGLAAVAAGHIVGHLLWR